MTGVGPVRIGHPLAGWDLAVVDKQGQQVEEGDVGELVIGGVGLARYLDPARDAEKYAAAPTLGWSRAYRSGDLVRLEAEGLLFIGRADDQVKLGGRRIELGEVDAALQGAAGGRRRRRRRTHRHLGAPDPGRLRGARPRRRARPRRLPRGAAQPAARRAGADAGHRGLPADPRLGQGRPERPAVAAGADGRRGGRRPAGDGGVAGRAVDPHPRGRGDRSGPGVLRRRRRQPRGRPAGVAAALAVPRGDRRRRLRQPAPGGPGPDARRVRPARSRPRGARSARRPAGPSWSRACWPCCWPPWSGGAG